MVLESIEFAGAGGSAVRKEGEGRGEKVGAVGLNFLWAVVAVLEIC